jgi:glycosyltransferase involved in cell wall biosynthesis
VPTYGRAATLGDTLRCALAQDYPRFEVIVATQDPEPPPYLDDLCACNPGKLRVIRLPQPNANAARNAAARVASGSILLSIDDDVLFEPDYAARHIARYVDPRVGYVMSLTRDRSDEPLAEMLRSNAALLGLRTPPASGDFVRIDWAPTCSTSYRRDAVERAGWFDPYFTGGVADDTDLAVRIGGAGYIGYLDTTILLTHRAVREGGYATRDPERTHARQLNDQRMRLYFAFKNRRLLGWFSTVGLCSSVFRTIVGISRRRQGWSGALTATSVFAGLAWRAARDARKHH